MAVFWPAAAGRKLLYYNRLRKNSHVLHELLAACAVRITQHSCLNFRAAGSPVFAHLTPPCWAPDMGPVGLPVIMRSPRARLFQKRLKLKSFLRSGRAKSGDCSNVLPVPGKKMAAAPLWSVCEIRITSSPENSVSRGSVRSKPDSISIRQVSFRQACASAALVKASGVQLSASAFRSSACWLSGAIPPTGGSRSRLVGKA